MKKEYAGKAKGRLNVILNLLRQYFPSIGEEAFLLKERRNYKKLFGKKQKDFWKKCFSPDEPIVLSGPFQGMRYLKGTVMGPPLPRWLGTYEQELHPVLSEVIHNRTYEKIVIVGSAEGYYSCGLARYFPEVPIYSFETTWLCRLQQKSLLRKNRITNVQVLGHLKTKNFRKLLAGSRALCFLDIEGTETEFCNEQSLLALKYVDLIIEVHSFKEFSAAQVEQKILNSLSTTHQVRVLNSEERNLSKIANLLPKSVTRAELVDAVLEHRGFPQKWIWAKAKNASRKEKNF